MRTILYWRKPDMVPPSLLIARQQRCEEVLMMAQALVITGVHNDSSHAPCTLHPIRFRVEGRTHRFPGR